MIDKKTTFKDHIVDIVYGSLANLGVDRDTHPSIVLNKVADEYFELEK